MSQLPSPRRFRRTGARRRAGVAGGPRRLSGDDRGEVFGMQRRPRPGAADGVDRGGGRAGPAGRGEPRGGGAGGARVAEGAVDVHAAARATVALDELGRAAQVGGRRGRQVEHGDVQVAPGRVKGAERRRLGVLGRQVEHGPVTAVEHRRRLAPVEPPADADAGGDVRPRRGHATAVVQERRAGDRQVGAEQRPRAGRVRPVESLANSPRPDPPVRRGEGECGRGGPEQPERDRVKCPDAPSTHASDAAA